MRILMVGAGAVGGYFGGRLLEAGRDITFLVRPGRAAELARDGLVIKSPHGDATLPNPPIVLAKDLMQPFDAVILGCKAYDLDSVIAAMAPAVGPKTMILPLLNGMKHLDTLSERFGRELVLGGECRIAATLSEERHVVQMHATHSITFGELNGGVSARIESLSAALSDAGFDAKPSEQVVQEMWEKWVFLATLAGVTCLMRAPVGDVLSAPGGEGFVRDFLEECRTIAEEEGYPPRTAVIDWATQLITTPASPLTASMMRDLENSGQIEADHVIGDLLRRGGSAERPLLRTAYIHMKAYEARRGRELSLGSGPMN